MKEFKIVPIRNGTVLDHIKAGTALAILERLGQPVPGSSKVISVAVNLPTGDGGLKDVLKFEDVDLDEADIKAIQSISPTGTINIIRNYSVADKTVWGR